jgi:hypothetical protein
MSIRKSHTTRIVVTSVSDETFVPPRGTVEQLQPAKLEGRSTNFGQTTIRFSRVVRVCVHDIGPF